MKLYRKLKKLNENIPKTFLHKNILPTLLRSRKKIAKANKTEQLKIQINKVWKIKTAEN